MILKSLEICDFRNIDHLVTDFNSDFVIFLGLNGQGKTNIIEAIWMLTGSKSFRNNKELELIQHKKNKAYIKGIYQTKKIVKSNEIVIQNNKNNKKGRFAKINGIDYGKAANIAGNFNAVVFTPDHLNLVKSGPSIRRKFIDAALCQLYPNYLSILKKFYHVLMQKNSLLKQFYTVPREYFTNLADIFDQELGDISLEITRRRNQYLEKLVAYATQYFNDLTSNSEKLDILYHPFCTEDTAVNIFLENREKDIKSSYTTAGPHREDFDIIINQKSAKKYASQGQQRSAVLCLKLAEAEMLCQITGENPVLLLDDVLSELDQDRKEYLLSQISGMQCFVTTCDASFLENSMGEQIAIHAGEIISK